MDTEQILRQNELPYLYSSYSALDRYFHTNSSRNTYITINAGLIDLAKVFPEINYPGLDLFDASIHSEEGSVYFRCVDHLQSTQPYRYNVLQLLYNPHTDSFLDPHSVYPELRKEYIEPVSGIDHSINELLQAAVLVSRYNYTVDSERLLPRSFPDELDLEKQRLLLIDLLTGQYPEKGLKLLMETGFIGHYWPELADMDKTFHSKEFHPEGNVWEHSLETFKYRKQNDLTLTFALLLHDTGKPSSAKTKERAFDGHTELGTKIGRKFLRRLGFSTKLIEDVSFLIRNHMFPGILDQIPIYRTEKLMAADLFPLLLEVYRCDLSSTYRGPEGYYRACKVFRSYLRNKRNPYRSADGKKLVRLYVE